MPSRKKGSGQKSGNDRESDDRDLGANSKASGESKSDEARNRISGDPGASDSNANEFQIPAQNDFSPPLNLEDTEVISRSVNEDPVKQRLLLIDAWKYRDELYETLFGQHAYVTPPNYSVPPEYVEKTVRDPNTVDGGSGDPGEPEGEDMHLAVFAYGPDPLRPYWTYVTAGLSSPWLQEDPDEVSGFGCELMIKSPVDAAWPAQILRSLAFYIFNHAGTIAPGVRIGLNAPIEEHSDSLLRNLFVWYADEAADCWYQLPSGGFGMFCVVGITDDECQYAESVDEYGNWCLQEVLRAVGIGQVSDPDRLSIVTDQNRERLNNARITANNFKP